MNDINKFAFTVDVEEWFQVGAYEDKIAPADWRSCESRVITQMDKLLALLDQKGVKGTFFCLGYVADRHPQLLRRLADLGHELGSHGMDHRRVHSLTEAEFLADIIQSKDMIEQASGAIVSGYRAPNFSFTKQTPWAYGALEQAGYKYSSSVYPVAHDHYGIPDAPKTPHRGQDTNVVEIPMVQVTYLGRSWPASGGGFFRLYPYWLSKQMFQKAASEGLSVSYYMHPWEIDPDQPRIEGVSLKTKFRHFYGQRGLEGKLARMLSDFSWGTMADTIYHPFVKRHGG